MIGYRTGRGDIGFWMGAPHRENGYMTEAVASVLGWLFGQGSATVHWECVVGNLASLSVARKVGFTFTGSRATTIPGRDGTCPLAWHGTLAATDSRTPKPGWPVIPN